MLQAGVNNDGDPGMVGFQKSHQPDAILACQIYIKNQHIHYPFVHQPHSVICVNPGADCKSMLLQALAQHLQQLCVVIDAEYLRMVWCSFFHLKSVFSLNPKTLRRSFSAWPRCLDATGCTA